MEGPIRGDRMKAIHAIALAALLAGTTSACHQRPDVQAAPQPESRSIWERDNLVAWSVGPYDAEIRGPEARAAMLQRLGFKRYSYFWMPSDIPNYRAEIQAMKEHGIAFQGWWAPFEPDDPLLDETLALFGLLDVQPRLWVVPPLPDFAALSEQSGVQLPADLAAIAELPTEEQIRLYPLVAALIEDTERRNWPRTAEEQRARVEQEAARIAAIAAKARPYGVKVDLYAHNRWMGVPENQAQVVEALRAQGIDDVGIVYNFSHSRNMFHDDLADFARVWQRIQPYVTTVNVAGVHVDDGTALLPGKGDGELAMMQVIEDSGWHGPVGVNAETGGDAEATLAKAIAGLSDLAQEMMGGE